MKKPAIVEGSYYDEGVFEKDAENNPYRTTIVYANRGKPFLRRMRVWQNVPSYMAPLGAQVHIFGGDENGNVRRTLKLNGEWRYGKGGLFGKNKRTMVRFGKIGKSGQNNFTLARVVVAAVHKYSIKQLENMDACHVKRLNGSERSNDKISNLYLGTKKDNAYDDSARKGRPKDGKRIPFVGRKMIPGPGEMESFETLLQAASKAGVSYRTVSRALKKGRPVGEDRWEFAYVPIELDENANERLEIIPDGETRDGVPFVTTEGRHGVRVTIDRDGMTYVDVEKTSGLNETGYRSIQIRGIRKQLHVVIAETFMKEEIAAAIIRTHGIPWDELDVDHKNGIETDNRTTNLRILSRLEHSNKNSRAVVEVDSLTNIVPGKAWISASQASIDTGISSGSIRSVCLGEYSHAKGRFFKFLDELGDNDDTEAAFIDARANFDLYARNFAKKSAYERSKK